MTNESLALSYLTKTRARIRTLDVLLDEDDYSDVVREAQEIVELGLKAMLRHRGIEPPKWHDVGPLLRSHAERFPEVTSLQMERLADDSCWLRKEREACFYGDVDALPTEEYDRPDAERARDAALFVHALATRVVLGNTNRDAGAGARHTEGQTGGRD